MDVLIVYGTNEGQTRKIADWAATYIREREHYIELRDSAASMSDLDLETFHAFIIAASVHQQFHQETVTNFVIAHHQLLNTKPSAFISVSLSAVLEEGQSRSAKIRGSFHLCYRLASAHDSPSRRCFALDRVRLLPRADRQIHRS